MNEKLHMGQRGTLLHLYIHFPHFLSFSLTVNYSYNLLFHLHIINKYIHNKFPFISLLFMFPLQSLNCMTFNQTLP